MLIFFLSLIMIWAIKYHLLIYYELEHSTKHLFQSLQETKILAIFDEYRKDIVHWRQELLYCILALLVCFYGLCHTLSAQYFAVFSAFTALCKWCCLCSKCSIGGSSKYRANRFVDLLISSSIHPSVCPSVSRLVGQTVSQSETCNWSISSSYRWLILLQNEGMTKWDNFLEALDALSRYGK